MVHFLKLALMVFYFFIYTDKNTGKKKWKLWSGKMETIKSDYIVLKEVITKRIYYWIDWSKTFIRQIVLKKFILIKISLKQQIENGIEIFTESKRKSGSAWETPFYKLTLF